MIAIMSVSIDALWGENSCVCDLAAGQVLFRSGDPVRHLYRVEEGVVRLIRPLPHGEQLTLQTASGGALLAEASLFATAYHCDAIAFTEAQVRHTPIKRVKDALGGDPTLAQAFAQHPALEVQAARARAEIVSLKTVSARLDAWLALNGGTLPSRGRWHEVAGQLGVTPEALYRELAKRRALGVQKS